MLLVKYVFKIFFVFREMSKTANLPEKIASGQDFSSQTTPDRSASNSIVNHKCY